MPVRVLHVVSNLSGGGAQVALKYLVENTDAKDIISFVYPLRQSHIDVSVTGKVIKLPYRNYDPRKFLFIVKFCRANDIDIIHAHLEKATILCLTASFFCNARVVVHEHGPVLFKGFEFTVYRRLFRLLRRRVARAIAVSQAVTTQLVKKVGLDTNQVKIVPNAVDFTKFKPGHPARDRIRKLLGVVSNDIVVGFVGRLHYIKGPDIFIEAAALLLKQSCQYLFVLVGQGPCYQDLLSLVQKLGIADRVRFLGFRDDIACVMDAFDVAVIPSRQEAHPLAALEIMRKKIPLICSGVGGLAQTVEDGVTALVLRENTPQHICNCVERLMSDSSLRNKLIENAYQLSLQFSIENYVNAVRKIYSEISWLAE